MHGTCSASGAISFSFITLQMHLLIDFSVCTGGSLSCLLARGRMARRQILCSRMWIPSFLFPPKAGVLLDIITSRRSIRGGGRYFCIMLHVRGVSCLTGWTHVHSEQKPSVSQPLPLEMVKAGSKQARSASPSTTSSTRQTRSTQKRYGTMSLCFSNYLRNF